MTAIRSARTSSASCAKPAWTATPVYRGNHIEHRAGGWRRRRNHARRDSEHVVPAVAAPADQFAAVLSQPTSALGPGVSRDAAPLDADRRPAAPQHASTSTMHGVHIPAGSLVNMVDFSANHDERIFAGPGAVRHLPRRSVQRQAAAQRLPQGRALQPHGVRGWPASLPWCMDLSPGSRGGIEDIEAASEQSAHQRRQDAERSRR